jgi:hypothetical protein
MALDHLGEAAQNDLPDIVGYLNFSAGAPDARFLSGLNRSSQPWTEKRRHPSLEACGSGDP